MKYLFIAMAVLNLLILSCKQDESKKSTGEINVLQSNDVEVVSLVDIDNQDIPEWTNGMKREEFFKKVFEKILSKKVTIYGKYPVELCDTENIVPYPLEDLNERMNWTNNNQNYTELKELLFYEKWDFNPDDLNFTKNIIGWSPVRKFEKDGQPAKMLTFYVYPEKSAKKNLIASGIISKFPWMRKTEDPNFARGFDEFGFLKYVIDGIKSGKIIAYDPIYLVDKSKRKLTPDELLKYYDLNPWKMRFYMTSILFEEDWYFDESTLAIQKDVKSIAFVSDPMSWEDKINEKIMFFIFPVE